MNAVWTNEEADLDERAFEAVAQLNVLACITALAAISVSLAIVGSSHHDWITLLVMGMIGRSF